MAFNNLPIQCAYGSSISQPLPGGTKGKSWKGRCMFLVCTRYVVWVLRMKRML
jgi:hypothetical protein